jgi:hypothetical protein
MAGTVTVSEITHTSVKKITWTWAADGSGDADQVTTAAFDGKLIGLTTDPDPDAPTDNYDVVINDADGFDVLLGAGANRDTANTEHVAEASLGAVSGSTLNLVVSNAGAANDGVVIVWLR